MWSVSVHAGSFLRRVETAPFQYFVSTVSLRANSHAQFRDHLPLLHALR